MIKTGLSREHPELNLETNNFINSSYFSFREAKKLSVYRSDTDMKKYVLSTSTNIDVFQGSTMAFLDGRK